MEFSKSFPLNRARSPHFAAAMATQAIRIQYGPGDRCVDRSTFFHCDKGLAESKITIPSNSSEVA